MKHTLGLSVVSFVLALLLGGCSNPSAACNLTIGGAGTPSIVFTSVPPIGSSNILKGQISHVAPTNFYVAVFIYVNGGFWTKPYYSTPETSINCDGTFSTDITTGGVDPEATVVAAFLLPSSYEPPLMNGESTLPASLYSNAVALTSVIR